MVIGLTTEQVLERAPDPSVIASGRRLASSASWLEPGADAGAIWGLSRGSGSVPYQVAVDLSDLSAYCSCPSRKFPCKHALGLMLLAAQGSVPPSATRPDFVSDWLARRAERARRARRRAEPTEAAETAALEAPDLAPRGAAGTPLSASPTPAEVEGLPQASGIPSAEPASAEDSPTTHRGQRQDEPGRDLSGEAPRPRRTTRVEAGLAMLELWLHDVVEAGLAHGHGQPREHQASVMLMSQRLIDAQAPTAAALVRDLLTLRWHNGDDWPSEYLAHLARLHLLTSAHTRFEDLDEHVQAAVRTRVGYPLKTSDVLGRDVVTDCWAVLGTTEEQQEQLTIQRTWVLGLGTGRWGMLMDFGGTFGQVSQALPPGIVVAGSLHGYPGRSSLRMRSTDYLDSVPYAAPPATTVGGALERRAVWLADDPWAEEWPVVIRARPAQTAGGTRCLVDDHGDAVDLVGSDMTWWQLLALTQGQPSTIAGELRRAGLVPLTVWGEDRACRV